jgi:predicted TIM-barrel fold metal-dependent hydrolase
MNRNGVFQSMCFATMAGTSARVFLEPADRDISLVMLQAYNDWHVDEWCGTYKGRFIPLGNLPLWDAELAAREVRRLASKGCRAISFPEAPHVLGLPSFHTDYWDPMLAAISDVGAVLCLHIGVSQRAISLAKEAPVDHPTFIGPMVCGMLTATDLIWGPTLRKFPALKVAFSEAGVGWISFFLERVDRHHRIQTWTKQNFGGKLPSEVLREHMLACFISDPTGLRDRHQIGVDLLAWESDYPHSDSSWPNSPEDLWGEFQATGCTDEEINKISYQNVARFFDFDPFAVINKDQAAVGALRALARDVDVSETPRAEYRRRYEVAASPG